MCSELSEILCNTHTCYLHFFGTKSTIIIIRPMCDVSRFSWTWHKVRQWGVQCSAKGMAFWSSTSAVWHHACPIADHVLVFWGLSPFNYGILPCAQKNHHRWASQHTTYCIWWWSSPTCYSPSSYSMDLLDKLWLVQQSGACAAFQTWGSLLVFTSLGQDMVVDDKPCQHINARTHSV